jgi:hypothetical protein
MGACMAFLYGIVTNGNSQITGSLMVLVSFAYAGTLAFAWLLIAWRVIQERYRKPSEYSHTRAAEREERWYIHRRQIRVLSALLPSRSFSRSCLSFASRP